MTEEDRFMQYVNKTDGGCWEWSSALAKNGYGVFHLSSGPTDYAHRVSYRIAGKPLDGSLVLDHLCRNRKCVNPDHLEQVSRGENVRRGLYLNGLCRKGHQKSNKPGKSSWCLECQRERRRAKTINTIKRALQ